LYLDIATEAIKTEKTVRHNTAVAVLSVKVNGPTPVPIED